MPAPCASRARPTSQRSRLALDALRKSGGNTGNSITLSNLADALLAAGDLDGAEAALRDGFAFVDQSGERYWLADLHRMSGQLALRRAEPDRGRAEACFHKAIEVAKQPGRAPARIACGDRSWPAVAGHESERRSSRLDRADPEPH